METVFVKTLDAKGPIYLQIAGSIREAIMTGRLKSGDWLPSSRNLADYFAAHRHTITASLSQLVAEGWLISRERQGFSVPSELPALRRSVRTNLDPESEPVAKPTWSIPRKVSFGAFSPSSDAIKYNFQSGLPDLRGFPVEDFRSSLWAAMRENDQTLLLNYSDTFGWPPLREITSQYIAEMRSVKNRTIMITNGSQEAMFMIMQLMLRKGDAVALEKISYPPARETLRWCGAQVYPIAQDEHGIDPDALEKVAKRTRLKLLFLTPTHQFPTTTSFSAERRVAVYNVAHKYQIPILEDDYDHDFHYESLPPLPLAATDPSQLVAYVSTFSKVMFPSSRLGFAALPESLAEQVGQFRRIVNHQNDSIMQAAMVHWMASGYLDRHLKKMKKVYEARLQHLEAALNKYKEGDIQLSWLTPKGGMAIWLNVHVDSDKVAAAALKKGVFVTAESYYRVDREPGTHLRLGFSNQNEEELSAGLKILIAVIKSEQQKH